MKSVTQLRWVQPAAVLTASSLAVLTGYGLAHHTSTVAALVIGGVAVITFPARWLPALGLSLFALLPVTYLHVPYVLVYLPPASLTLIVWLARRDPRKRGASAPALGASIAESGIYLFALWCLIATLLSVNKRLSIEWTLAFFVGVVMFARFVSRDGFALVRLRTAWIALGALLGVFGLVEAELLHNNPLFGGTYASSPVSGFSQYTVWATYRATTTLGHPLLNSTFFSAAAGLAVSSYLKSGSRWLAAAGALASAGVLVTASRSGLLALTAAVLGAGFVSLFDPASRQRAIRSLVLIGTVVAIAGTTLAATTLSRSSTQEGSVSTSARTSLFQEGVALAHKRPFTGFGPGALVTASRQFSSDATPGNYENSYLEVAISTGVIGLVLFVLLCLGLLARSFSTRDAGAFGALLGYLVSAGAFNLLQGYMPALVMLGALAALALGATRTQSDAAPTTSPDDSSSITLVAQRA